MPRNLISLIDGTMVSASQTDTYSNYSNIFELACLLQLNDRSDDGSPQIVFYTSGISSQPDNSNIYNLITGNSIKSQIIDQYTNICANFDFENAKAGKPDKIYLFGFSRGAMAIRALTGLIAEFGLLRPRDIRHLPRILDAWDNSRGAGSIRGDLSLTHVEVEFVGLFDSVMGGVESMSLFNPIRFNNPLMPGRCKHGVQILAIDENRSLFKPKPWGGASRGLNAAGRMCGDRYLRQIWMPGVHSDVGGTGEPVWGRASLLAMTFYLDKLTQLSLDSAWITEKESRLRESIRENLIFIRPHKSLFTRFARRASQKVELFERRHPIGERLSAIQYNGAKSFNWRDSVLNTRFAGILTDEDLAEYFSHILAVEDEDPASVASESEDEAFAASRI